MCVGVNNFPLICHVDAKCQALGRHHLHLRRRALELQEQASCHLVLPILILKKCFII